MGVKDWSTTAADNDDADGTINWVENQDPSTVNNSARAMMAAIAAWRDAIGGAKTSAGSSNAYTLTTGLSLGGTYINGFLLAMEASFTNTGAATIAIDGGSAKSLKTPGGAALDAGAITAGGIYLLAYESGADVVIVINAAAALPSWVSSATANGQAIVTAANYAAMRALLDLEAGTDFYSKTAADAAFQPLDAQLTVFAGIDFKDEDTMSSDSATAVPSQQSTKAYVDAHAGAPIPTASNGFGIGDWAYLEYTSNSAVTNGSTTTSVRHAVGYNDDAGTTNPTRFARGLGGAPGGTWKNISGVSLDSDGSNNICFGTFVRTA